jgi:hypothetical protein
MNHRSIADAATEAMPSTERHNLGVLFVHGIGNQPRASTLVESGTPLIEWLKILGERAEIEDAVEVTAASLSGEGPEPAHLTLRLALPARAGTSDEASSGANASPTSAEAEPSSSSVERRWLLAEAWWAESFAMPRFGDLCRWGLGVLPWAIGSHFGLPLGRAWRQFLLAWRGDPNPAQRGFATARVVAALVALIFGLVVSMFVTVALLGLLVLGLLPWQRLRNAIMRLQVGLASSIGDSYTFVMRPIESAAILSQFQRDLAWLSDRCDRVAVVAHSQGGAVACLGLARLLSRPEAAVAALPEHEQPANKVKLLVTYGSGLFKLADLRELKKQPIHRSIGKIAMSSIALLALVALGLAGLILEQRAPGDAIGSLVTLSAVGAAGLLFFFGAAWDLAHAKRPALVDTIDATLKAAKLRWLDLHSTADPVSNGPLFDDSRRATGSGTAQVPHVESYEVVNRSSLLGDHTSYWQSRDDFVTRVGTALLDCDGARVEAPGPEVIESLQVLRKWRVAMLRVAVWSTAAAMGALVLRHSAEWRTVSSWAARSLTSWIGGAVGLEIAVPPRPPLEVWGATFGWMAMPVALLLTMYFVWTVWDDRETARLAPSRAPTRPGVIYLALVAVHCKLAYVFLFGSWFAGFHLVVGATLVFVLYLRWMMLLARHGERGRGVPDARPEPGAAVGRPLTWSIGSTVWRSVQWVAFALAMLDVVRRARNPISYVFGSADPPSGTDVLLLGFLIFIVVAGVAHILSIHRRGVEVAALARE